MDVCEAECGSHCSGETGEGEGGSVSSEASVTDYSAGTSNVDYSIDISQVARRFTSSTTAVKVSMPT